MSRLRSGYRSGPPRGTSDGPDCAVKRYNHTATEPPSNLSALPVKAATTGTITEFGNGLNAQTAPGDIVTGPDGNLWFTNNSAIPASKSVDLTTGKITEYTDGTPAIGKVNPATGKITEYTEGLNADSGLTDIVAGPDGNLWFIDDGFSPAIGKIDPGTGKIIEYTDGLISGSQPTDIVAGPDGNLWFTDQGWPHAAIGKIDPANGKITEYTSGLTDLSQPGVIMIGPDGNLWFTDQGSSGGNGFCTPAIGRIDPTTGSITEYTSGLAGGSDPEDIVAGPDGELWFTDSRSNPGYAGEFSGGAIGKINPGTGNISEYTSGLNNLAVPGKIVVGSDNNLWFTSDGYTPAIGKVDPANGNITEFTSGQIGNDWDGPEDIVTGADGNLWFDYSGDPDPCGTPAIGKVDPATGKITEYSNGLNSVSEPKNIVVGPEGNIWFTDPAWAGESAMANSSRAPAIGEVFVAANGDSSKPVSAIGGPTFSDIGDYGWAADAIETLAGEGIIKGNGLGTFDPAGQVTRAQFAALMQRTFSLPAASQLITFNDVDASSWEYAPVEALTPYMDYYQVPGGGYAFHPEQAMDRQDVGTVMVKILAVSNKLPVLSASDTQTVLASVTDASDIAPALQTYVATAIKAGLIKGFPDGSFQPSGSLTRAQIAVLIQRLQTAFLTTKTTP